MTSTKTTQLRRIRFSLWILVAAAALALGGAYFVRTIGIREPPGSSRARRNASTSRATL